ncbi:ubiquitin-conjugating enzyme variant Kua like proteinue [Trypanosoma conorhini]|uniref:Ubiquitin-conjugating enzyme variant Kua like proteinue n=1 Tax=Trypanosoma conorhini TaxID=83891 RepID=A0A3R7RXU8_9TRYP|nr:ubiquitin-conjugating enzyme variant Kua like proteinue [Trypanosoma conorhini]RNF15422.1 ubiquitin-conjugating enzyme variant Kua like proteinue [Trypanosoma conorhini]
MNSESGNSSPVATGDHRIRKANAEKLAAGYTKKKRLMECCYLYISTYLWFTQFVIVARYFVHGGQADLLQLAWSPLMILCAMTLADFISGLAHWGLDTWGTPDTLIFGNFIRSFREHHVDQVAMTKHDFIETNADTTLPLIPLLLLQRYCLSRPNTHGKYEYNIHNGNVGGHVFLLTLTIFVALTNEVHKWSHMAKPPAVVRFLMSCHVILTPRGHRKHHTGNYDQSYCITTGWMNGILDYINFWRWAETVVTALTGEIPRANDQQLLGK